MTALRPGQTALNPVQVRARYWNGAEKSANFTAENHAEYVITATCTVTDPTPAAGHGFSCLIVNGTATIGGVAFAIVGTLIRRYYHSGAWLTKVNPPLDGANTWTAAQTFRAANAVRSEAASTQDAMILAGRAGGSSSYASTLTTAALTASRTITFPDATGTAAILSLAQTFTASQRFDAAEAILLGTAGTAGNGMLQLASGTTKANGIAFGTDCFLYRIGSNLLRCTAGFEVNSDRAYGAGVRMFDLGSSSKYFRCDGGAFQVVNDAFTQVLLSIADDGTHTIGNGTGNIHNLACATATTVGAAGAASALPANPTGYVRIAINGTTRKIPFYAD